jgi:DNA topoisomerase-2
MNERETENFTTLDETGRLKIFENAEEIISYFVNFRLSYYEIRKNRLLQNMRDEEVVLSNKVKFIKSIIEEKLVLNNRKKDEIEKDLQRLEFDKKDNSWNYLTSMPIFSLTKEKLEELMKSLDDRRVEISKIENTNHKDMYRNDLQELKKKILKNLKAKI